MFNWLKNWSGWSTAGSIFIARLEVFTGFLLAALQGIDWTALMSLDFTKGLNTPVLIGAGILVLKGVISEMTRRHNAKDL